MNIQFATAGTFKHVIEAISDILKEGVFVVDDEGIHFKAIDPTMVLSIEMHYGKNNFEVFNIEGRTDLALNIDMLKKILKKVKADDKVFFIVDGDNRLQIVIKGKQEKKFILPFMDVEMQEFPELNLEFKGKIEILSSFFSETIDDASSISDEILFSFVKEENMFKAFSKGDLMSMEAKFTKESENVLSLDIEESVSAKYSIDYLKRISKAKKISPSVKVSINHDAPAKFEFENGNIKLVYLLAPRV